MTTRLAVEQYEALTEQTAIQYAKNMGVFPKDAELGCAEIGDGNLNYVFRISDPKTNRSIIIKQALPYAKVVGESWPLTLKRAEIEANALKKHGEFVPHLVPEVLGVDPVQAITVIEDLSRLRVAREGLVAGEHYPKLAEHIGEYLACTLFATSDFALHPFEKKKLVKEFSNPELCKITEDLVFTDPFFDSETNNVEPLLKPKAEALWSNPALKLEVAKLKKSFLTEAEALVHGDLHTGSIFASEEETKVFDPEFAFYGPIGFDIGQFLANLIAQAVCRKGDAKQLIIQQIEQTWEVFSSKFSELWRKGEMDPSFDIEGYEASVLQKIYVDTLGFAGCELIRRTIGLALIADLENIKDVDQRIQAKTKVLELGEALILKRFELSPIQKVTSLIEEKVQ